MRSMWIRCLLLFLLCYAPLVFADGKVFSEKPFAKIDIPDQQAIITYVDGTEKLVIETHFSGEGKNFAWIVPLPSEPQIEAVSPGVFKTIPNLFGPEIISETSSVAFHAFFIWFIGILAIAYFTKKVQSAWFGIPLIFYIVSGISIPNMSGEMAALPKVKVVKKQIVGSYDTAVLKSKTADDLMKWLSDNKYYAPDELKSAAEYYVKKDWVFAAVKMTSGPSASKLSVHPLSFTFKTSQPVYPMRMTAVDNETTNVSLYVFGKERAHVDGFNVERCDKTLYLGKSTYNNNVTNGAIALKHQELQKIIGEVMVGTKLTARLSKEQMLHDCTIEWHPFSSEQKVLYTQSAAISQVLAWIVPIALFLITIILFFDGALINAGMNISRRYSVGLLAIIFALSLFITLHCVGQYQLAKTRSVSYNYDNVYYQYALAIRSIPTNEISEERLRLEARKFFDGKMNYLSDEPIKEEDSPGNYIIRKADGKYDLVKFDYEGGEMSIPLEWQ